MTTSHHGSATRIRINNSLKNEHVETFQNMGELSAWLSTVCRNSRTILTRADTTSYSEVLGIPVTHPNLQDLLSARNTMLCKYTKTFAKSAAQEYLVGKFLQGLYLSLFLFAYDQMLHRTLIGPLAWMIRIRSNRWEPSVT